MTGKSVTLNVSKKGVTAQPSQKAQAAPSKSSKRRVRTRNRAAKGVAPVAATISSQGGQQTEMFAKALEVKERMMSNQAISDAGRGSVMTILNPCGELGSEENAKFPDGTLSQSGIQRFRQFETILAPWQTISSLDNTTDNWSLYILSPAAFRTICVFVAVRDGRSLTDAEFGSVFETINNAIPPVQYPAWGSVGSSSSANPPTNVFYSVYSYRAASLDVDVATGESRTIESFRVVGDGMVVLHNTPTLWNQGSFAVGQFKTDFAQVETDTTDVATVFSIVTGFDAGGVIYADVSVYASNGDCTQLGMLGPVHLTPSVGLTSTWSSTTNVFLPSPENVPVINFGDSFDLHITGTVGSYQVEFITARPYSLIVPISSTVPSTYITNLAANGPAFLVDGFSINPSQILLNMPALNQDSIAQADPKFSAELMKCHEGFYAVRRYFEPKLNMNLSNVSGPIKLEMAGMNKQEVIDAPGGICGDLLDRNGAFLVGHIKGMSKAASPVIKACRFVEFMPAQNSSLAPFVGPTPAKDEDAEELFRQMQLEGPHSYIPDANFLGTLASFVMGVVNSIPVFLRTARGISGAVVKALDWAETKYAQFTGSTEL